MYKCKSNINVLPAADSVRGKRANIFCVDGIWYDFNYNPPKVWVDNDT